MSSQDPEATGLDVVTASPEQLFDAIEAAGSTPDADADGAAARDELNRRLEAGALDVADEPFAKLIAALAAAQGEFPTIEKTQTATVAGKDGKQGYTYKYADLGDVLAKVRPILSAHGLALIQRTRHDAGKVRLLTELHHVGGGMIDSDVDLGRDASNPQQFGGSLTYLRRYEAVTLLGIAAEEDRDAQDVTPERNGMAAATPAELPKWANVLSRDRVAAELAPPLKVLVGEEGARTIYNTLRDSYVGGAPAVLVPFVNLVVGTMLSGDPDELTVRLINEQRARRDAKVAAEVKAEEERKAAERAEAETAQAAAEAPDAPSPVETTDEAIARLAPEADAKTAPAPDIGPAGKTPMPDISALTGADAEVALRAAGCICDSPLEATLNEKDRNDQCPLVGHGIPF